MKVVGIVQARMASTRLPGKVLEIVEGKPLIIHMLDRACASKTINELWLATSEDATDDPLCEAVEARGYRVFRGSQNDVLDRFSTLAGLCKAEVVVRLTGDCPLQDPEIIDYTVSAFLRALPKYTYASNVWPPTFPDGLDVEVFLNSTLREASDRCVDPSEREHVTPGIHRQFEASKPEILNVEAPADFSHLRWTLDYPEDLVVISEVFGELYRDHPKFTWMDVLALMTRRPELIELNRSRSRNEGAWAMPK